MSTTTTTTSSRTVRRSIRRVAAVTLVMGTCTVMAGPAFAQDTAQDAPAVGQSSTYAVPFEAIDGMTMAQYVARHQARDPRTHTVV